MAIIVLVLQGVEKMSHSIGEIINNNQLIEIDTEKTKQYKHGYYWKVKCLLCGSIRSIRSDSLNDNCRSCAAKNRKNNDVISIRDDLTNKEFGNWIVLYKVNKPNYWHCRCKKCGTERDVFRGNLTQGLSKGCGCEKSWGEKQLIFLLDKNKINYKREYSFLNLKTDKNGSPRFDFAIFNNNQLYCLIEYNGRQHYEYDKNWKMTKKDFQRLQYIDKLKKDYCIKNHIKLYCLSNQGDLEEFIQNMILFNSNSGINK